jgi:hypothetical protein
MPLIAKLLETPPESPAVMLLDGFIECFHHGRIAPGSVDSFPI